MDEISHIQSDDPTDQSSVVNSAHVGAAINSNTDFQDSVACQMLSLLKKMSVKLSALEEKQIAISNNQFAMNKKVERLSATDERSSKARKNSVISDSSSSDEEDLDLLEEEPDKSSIKTYVAQVPRGYHSPLPTSTQIINPMVINQIDPGTFQGDHTKASDWLNKFDNIMNINGYSSEQKLLRVPAYLSDSAASWLRTQRVIRQFSDWPDFKKRFLQNYCGSSSGVTLKKLVDNRQGSHEHITTYFTRTVDLCTKYKKNMPEDEIICFLEEGWLTSIQESLATSKPRHEWSLSWLDQCFQRFPRKDSHHNKATLPADKRSTQNKTPHRIKDISTWICANCEEKGHEPSSCPKPLDQERISINRKKIADSRKNRLAAEQPKKDQASQPKAVTSSSRPVHALKIPKTSDIPLATDNIEFPVLTVEVNGVEVEGRVDSGSYISIIPKSYLKRLKLVVLPWEFGPSIAYNNTKVEFSGMATAYVVQKSFKTANALTLAIGDDKDNPIPYWGRDLLNALRLGVGFDGCGKTVIQPVNVDRSTEPPRSIQQISPEPKIADLLNEVGKPYHENKGICDDMFRKFEHVFSKNPSDIGRTNTLCHKINLVDESPTFKPPYSVPVRYKDELRNTINKQLDMGTLRKSQSDYAAPVFFVKKDHGTDVRLVADYRELNKKTVPDRTPMPRPDDVVGLLAGMTTFAKFDITAMFNQIPVADEDIHKTAIITPSGLYECPVMPFGLMNAPATAVRLMREVLRGLDREICCVYFDDIIVFAKNLVDLVQRCTKILSRLAEHNLKLKPSKCKFATDSVVFLGFKISARGSEIDPGRLEAVKNFAVPKNATEVRSFHGLANFNRQYIKNFAEIAAPFGPIMGNKPFEWTPECQQAFETLKKALIEAPIVVHFDPLAKHELRTDASNVAIGAVLYQNHPTNPDLTGVVHYFSKTLNQDQRRYSATKRELYAAYASIKELNHYLYGAKFTLVTDHQALSLLRSKKDPHNNFARWTAELQEFDFDVVYKKGSLHCDADCLSRLVNYEEVDQLNVEPWLPPEAVKSIHSLTSQAQSSQNDVPSYDFRAGQREDQFCSKYITILEAPDLTEADKSRRAYRFTLQDGILYRQEKENVFLTVIPQQRIPAVLLSCHDCPLAGHLGFSRTYGLARSRFYWPKMRRDIKQYVNSCRGCQFRKPRNTRLQGFIKPMPIAEDVFDTLGMDLLVKLPKSKEGYNTILVVTDNLSKFVIAVPLRNELADTIIYGFFNNVIAKHGCPKMVISDCGRNLIGERSQDFFKMFGIKRNTTSPYHPESNGQTERFNRTLAESLSIYVDRNQRDWPVYLQAVVFAYNITEHSVTRVSPFELVYGRKPRIPLDNIVERSQFIDPANPIVGPLANERIELIKRLIRENQLANKRRIDNNRSHVTFQVGDTVILARPTRVRGGVVKLTNTYIGPFKITKKISDLNFELSDLNQESRTFVVHVCHLRKFTPREEPVSDDLVDPDFIPKEALDIEDSDPEFDFPETPILIGSPIDQPDNVAEPTINNNDDHTPPLLEEHSDCEIEPEFHNINIDDWAPPSQYDNPSMDNMITLADAAISRLIPPQLDVHVDSPS